jgi:pyruvate/2-oxoglutarate dehydrogenase complex dihydrolipoamide acyltransferase (E2) component
MDSGAVLSKTAKGVEEMKTRAHGLTQRLRSLLIMVDGAATVGDLIARLEGVTDVQLGLQTLVDQGYVEISGAGAAAQAPAAKAAAAARDAPAAAQSREQALSALSRMLHDALGPDADALSGALEKADTRPEFVAAAKRCADALGALVGEKKAQSFRERAAACARLYEDIDLGGG